MTTKTDTTKEATESVISAATKIIEDAATKSREQFDSALEAIAPKVKELKDIELKVPAGTTKVVDGYFDFASKMLATQREFFTNLIADPEAKVEAATASVKRAAKSTAKTAKSTAKTAKSTAKTAKTPKKSSKDAA